MDVQYGTWTDRPNKDVPWTGDVHWGSLISNIMVLACQLVV